jgi:hypothetical protein
MHIISHTSVYASNGHSMCWSGQCAMAELLPVHVHCYEPPYVCVAYLTRAASRCQKPAAAQKRLPLTSPATVLQCAATTATASSPSGKSFHHTVGSTPQYCAISNPLLATMQHHLVGYGGTVPRP